MKKGWERCDNLLGTICCKDLDAGRTWICVKGFPRIYGKYIKCVGKKGTEIEVCRDFIGERKRKKNDNKGKDMKVKDLLRLKEKGKNDIYSQEFDDGYNQLLNKEVEVDKDKGRDIVKKAITKE